MPRLSSIATQVESKNPEDAARPQRSAARTRPGNSVNRLRVCRLLLLTTLCAGGCASTPDRMEQTAARLGLSAGQVTGQGYRLRVYRNAVRQAKGRLHIYLDGDGTPWLTPTRIGRDPTPRNHLVLRLLAMDPGAALYLSRPCYNGRAGAPGCGPWMWTFGRYSETVVAAMESALRELVVREGASELVLIGYSGGGVLAWLLAQRVPEVLSLIHI